jgi:hypothetical protein
MADYNIVYRMPFDDMLGVAWRIDFLEKDGAITADPLILIGSDSPLKLDKQNRDENQFSPIIKTTATVTYIYRGGSDPAPETFIDIENDKFIIEVYKNNTLEWKGFLNGDNNTYPWLPVPFSFTLTATDFTFMDSTLIDLNETDLFLYDYITLGDFFNRTLFYATGYSDISLKILYNKKPAVIGTSELTALYIHTDAFYDFINGRDFVTICLERLLTSIGARLFYAAGSYWMQFLQDIGTSPQTILTITPDDLIGTTSINLDTNIIMTNGIGSELTYLGRSQNVLITKALKQQSFNYDIKTINQLINFDWHAFNSGHPDDWGPATGMTFERHGSGSVEDPYVLRNFTTPDSFFRAIQQQLSVNSGQRLSIQFKVVGNYAKNLAIGFTLGIASTAQYALTSGGTWGPYNTGSVSNIVFPLEISSSNTGTFEITTDPIPANAVNDLHISIGVINAADTVPGGETPYIDIYPVFLGIFNDEYISYTEKVVNPKKYSLIADDFPLFFLDIQQFNISNTIYYDDAGVKTPLPAKDWSGKSIDEIATKLRADQQARPGFSVLGDFTSNALSFQQMVSLYDKDMKPELIIRDSYQVRQCKHSIMVSEIMEEDAANAIYTITPVRRQQN